MSTKKNQHVISNGYAWLVISEGRSKITAKMKTKDEALVDKESLDYVGKDKSLEFFGFSTADIAKEKGYKCVTLDSGHQRQTAHRLYLNEGYSIVAHHFSKPL